MGEAMDYSTVPADVMSNQYTETRCHQDGESNKRQRTLDYSEAAQDSGDQDQGCHRFQMDGVPGDVIVIACKKWKHFFYKLDPVTQSNLRIRGFPEGDAPASEEPIVLYQTINSTAFAYVVNNYTNGLDALEKACRNDVETRQAFYTVFDYLFARDDNTVAARMFAQNS